MVATGLREGIPVSRAGLAMGDSKIGALQDEIESVIGSKPEAEISPLAVSKRIDQITPEFERQVNPESDLETLSNAKEEFLRQHSVAQPYTRISFRPVETGLVDEFGKPYAPVGAVPEGESAIQRPQPMTAKEAQAIKKGTYTQLGKNAYGTLRPATVEAQKALARGIKEELEVPFPELRGLNAREGDLLNLRGAIQKAVQRTSNHEPVGLEAPLIGSLVRGVTGSSPAAVMAGAGAEALRFPGVRSGLAIGLNRMGRPVGVLPRIEGAGALGRASISLDRDRDSARER